MKKLSNDRFINAVGIPTTHHQIAPFIYLLQLAPKIIFMHLLIVVVDRRHINQQQNSFLAMTREPWHTITANLSCHIDIILITITKVNTKWSLGRESATIAFFWFVTAISTLRFFVTMWCITDINSQLITTLIFFASFYPIAPFNSLPSTVYDRFQYRPYQSLINLQLTPLHLYLVIIKQIIILTKPTKTNLR